MGNVRRKSIETNMLHISGCFMMESGSRVSGSLIPMVTDDPGHSLGSVDVPWKEAYLSSGSLHIDGRKTLYAESGSIKMRDGISVGDDDFMMLLREVKTKLVTLEGTVAALSESKR